MKKSNYLIILSLFFISLINAMERPGAVTRARAHQERTARDRVLSELHMPVNEWSEESKQHYITHYWHGLLQLKSTYLQDAELWAHRSVTSWAISALCAVGTYHASSTLCQICGGGATIVSCLCGLDSCDWACYSCKKEAATRKIMKNVAEKMGWAWQELQ